MPFVKVDCGILDSTLWIDRPARDVFLTALLMAEPFHTNVALSQIEVRSLDGTGFVVPPGYYGFVRAAGSGIIRRAGLDDVEQGMGALERLGRPEADSRSPDHEGRRLVRVDGGYVVLNYFKYRDRDYGAAERMRRLRERRKDGTVTPNTRNVPPNVTQADAEAEVDTRKKKPSRRAARTGGNGKPEGDTTWISPYWDPWKAEMGGDPPKAIVRAFKPLRGRPEWENGTLLRRWTNFLTGLKVDPKYLGSPAAQVTKFASAHALYDDPDWFLSDRERASMEGLFG